MKTGSELARGPAPGVIFDLDGTLADTLEDIANAVNHALHQAGLPVRDVATIRAFVGDGLSILLARSAGSDDPRLVEALVPLFRDYYRRHCLTHTRLYRGVEEPLNALRRAGCPLAVLSNKPDDFTRQICGVLLGRWPFVECLGAREGVPRKPDPAMALELVPRLDRPVERIVLVGDSEMDVQTARAAGMRSIAVTWGFRDRATLARAAPDALIDDPVDLAGTILGNS